MTEVLEARGLVMQTAPRSLDEGTLQYPKLNRNGVLCVIDFYTQMAMEKRGFELRAGIDSNTETGDAPIATTVAEMAINVVKGWTAIPVYFNVGVVVGAGTVQMMALKVLGSVSSGGTVRIPQPLWTDSTIAAITTGLMNDAGGVTVGTDAVTTTNVLCQNSAAAAMGAFELNLIYTPLLPAICTGVSSVFAQIGATGTGQEYKATLHYIEIPTTVLE